MKTLNKNQIDKIQKLICTKSGSVNKSMAHLLMVGIVQLMNGRPLYYMNEGSRGKRSYATQTSIVAAQVVEIMGYRVADLNDAPRGGVTGDHYLKSGRKVKFNWPEFVKLIEA